MISSPERLILKWLRYLEASQSHGAPALAADVSQPKIDFRQTFLKLAKANQRSTLRDIYSAMKKRDPTLTDESFVEEVMILSSEEAVTLEERIPTGLTLPGYLSVWYTNVWFYIVLAISALAVTAVYLLPGQFPIVAVRWLAGSVFVLFLPGHVTLRALFPKRELDDIESVALSIGLSLALVPLLLLVLNYTAWGIRLEPIIITLTSYTVLVGFAATWRKYKLLQESNSSRLEKESNST